LLKNALTSTKERIQLLYLLKSQKAQTIKQASELLGRHRVTLQDWLSKYRQGGLESLLGRATSPGRLRKIPSWAEKALARRLEEPEGMTKLQCHLPMFKN
jgi:transposase